MKKIISYLLIATGLFLFAVNVVNARECHTVYGGGEVCENGDLTLDKKVFNPEANEYWDNIAADSYTFSPEQEVKFSLRIKNITDVETDGVRLVDDFARLVDYMFYLAADGKEYPVDFRDNELKFIFDDVDADEEITVYFTARFKGQDELPVGTTCITNKAKVYSREDDVSDSDYASFCVKTDEGKIITEKTPDTGF
ncbi:MAG: hypothetical protein GX943_01560, partial [Candidatus Pacebacteria bacterium]|nr:hypothetical protein [Candidatus Paceibacterota bacterium]